MQKEFLKKFMKKYLTGILSCLLLISVHAYCNAENYYENDFIGLSKELSIHNSRNVMRFVGTEGEAPYAVIVHSPKISKLLKNTYSSAEKKALKDVLSKTCAIKVLERPWGSFVQAASFENAEIASATNYDAVWMRDTIWAYLALNQDENSKKQAKSVLLTMVDYIATPAQIERMKRVIADPGVLDRADGQMQAVHIRFNANSEKFEDVVIDGKEQPWNHKQNDALGLLLDAVISAVKTGEISVEELQTNNRMMALAYLTAYFNAAEFYKMPDSGAWEEDARLNTSSVALVTSSLENLQRIAGSNDLRVNAFNRAFWDEVDHLGLSSLNQSSLQKMIDNGYLLIEKQLLAGGESPGYPKNDARYRTADAALLNLIYPAKLSRLTLAEKERVLDIVQNITGDLGIKRYVNDNYQCADFWFRNIKADVDENSFKERQKLFIKGTEAQWFFDSWYAKACLLLYRESGNKKYLGKATLHFNRALAQVTADDHSMLGADGKPVPLFALPESYNFIENEGQLWDVPSPITPLNWAKASMAIMFDEYIKSE